jgi:hypothetical protein
MSDDLLAVVAGIARASSTLTCVRCGATLLPNRGEPPVSLRLRATAAGWQTEPEILCRAERRALTDAGVGDRAEILSAFGVTARDAATVVVVRRIDELRTLLAEPIDPTVLR